MIAFHAIGDWPGGHVRISWAATSSRQTNSEVERIIEETWTRESQRLGKHLFDGPMCRMESFEASGEALNLLLSRTSYKPFVGTNLHNADLAERFGPEVMANPVGVSTIVETSDAFLMLGRRNAAVVYYPHRVHPFAGSLEPTDGDDASAGSFRELHEELSLDRDHILDHRCLGIAADSSILQPELIFAARTRLDRAEIERRVDREEHGGSCAIANDAHAVATTLSDSQLTPIAVASLLLWGRFRFGERWFDRALDGIRPRPLVPAARRP